MRNFLCYVIDAKYEDNLCYYADEWIEKSTIDGHGGICKLRNEKRFGFYNHVIFDCGNYYYNIPKEKAIDFLAFALKESQKV